MHPDPRERPADGLRLRTLVLVMREDEVEPAAVDQELGPERLLRHRRALDVPAGPPRPPRRVPRRVLALLRRLPEREVAGILLQRARLLVLDLVGALTRERPVALEARDPEVDVSPGLVRVTRVRSAPRSAPRSRGSSRSRAAARRASRARTSACRRGTTGLPPAPAPRSLQGPPRRSCR